MGTIRTIIIVSCISVGLMSVPVCASAWGQKGHDVTCAVAQNHLTRKAGKKISDILDGRSIVYWANWMDNASHSEKFAYTSTWHYKNVDASCDYDTFPVNENGDVLTAIDAQVKALKSGTLDKEQSALALKMLVHFIGDLHCPMHLGHATDKGGNKWQVQYFQKGTNLHSVWDSDIVESAHKWGYDEWAKEIDVTGRDERKEIVKGTPYDWGKETFALATSIYDSTPTGSKLSYDYVSEWTPVIERQLLVGGLRLASILNDIFK